VTGGKVRARRGWAGVWSSRQLVFALFVVGSALAVMIGIATFGGRPNTALLTATQSSTAGRSGTIAYTSADVLTSPLTVTGRWIYLVDPDGGSPQRLVEIPTESQSIELIPADTDGGGVRTGPALHWSPDGTQIAFRLYGERPFRDKPGIYVVDRDGTDLRRIVETDTVSPGWIPSISSTASTIAWSPDGTRIAYISPDYSNGSSLDPEAQANGGLYIVDVATSTTEKLTGPDDDTDGAAGSLSWSPDGSEIAFGRNLVGDAPALTESIIVAIKVDGSGERPVVVPEQGSAQVGQVSWSPDGSTIAFLQEGFSDIGDVSWTVELVNPDGSGQRTLGDTGVGGCCLHSALSGMMPWSPDGTQLVTDVGNSLVMSLTEGGLPRTVTGRSAGWSSDGTRLVFASTGWYESDSGGSAYWPPRVYVSNADGTNAIRLGEGDFPAWSP